MVRRRMPTGPVLVGCGNHSHRTPARVSPLPRALKPSQSPSHHQRRNISLFLLTSSTRSPRSIVATALGNGVQQQNCCTSLQSHRQRRAKHHQYPAPHVAQRTSFVTNLTTHHPALPSSRRARQDTCGHRINPAIWRWLVGGKRTPRLDTSLAQGPATSHPVVDMLHIARRTEPAPRTFPRRAPMTPPGPANTLGGSRLATDPRPRYRDVLASILANSVGGSPLPRDIEGISGRDEPQHAN